MLTRPFGLRIPNRLYRTVYAHMARRNANRWLKSQGVFDLALKVADRFDYTVQSGPFKGMRYTREAILSRHATPTLIGQYERQIHPHLTAALNRCEFAIDIGHAEGFYAVGIARLGKPVVAFDADPHERQICKKMAIVNGVADRIENRRWCDGSTLSSLARRRRPLIISDIEGGECELFTPDVISSIRHCDLLVELHAPDEAGNERFVRRFRDLFDIEIIDHPAAVSGEAMIAFLGADAPRMASEYRAFQQWMIATPKAA